MWQAKALQVIPKVIEIYPKSRFIFLTLTVKNCELNDLRETLKWMHNSWMKLLKRKEFAPIQGWIRSVEVTRAADDTAHPHYHVLLMVNEGYFKRGYVSQKRWSEVWQSCLAVGYTPIVDVRSVRPGKREKDGEGVLMSSAICETLKYSVKPAECLVDDSRRKLSNAEWLSGLTNQLYKTRAIATGGILKQYLKELEQEPEDLIHADENGLTSVDDESPRLAFGWRERTKRYVMTEAVDSL
jgi:plasmid rolling circle replication initiator protein Rep